MSATIGRGACANWNGFFRLLSSPRHELLLPVEMEEAAVEAVDALEAVDPVEAHDEADDALDTAVDVEPHDATEVVEAFHVA
jgi:hypothetical protein